MSDVLETAKQRFQLVCDAEREQRVAELDDLRFDAGDQWPDDVKTARGGGVIDGVPIPARPMLTISKIDQPVQLIINAQKNARLGIFVHADSPDADDDTAEVIQGLIRHIEQRSRAELARNWAFERAVKTGRGFYRILKRYVDDSGMDFDQELVIERILNQASVYLDPYAQQPDWSDMQWAFVGAFLPADRFRQEFPKAALAQSSDDELTSLGDSSPDWMGMGADGTPTIRVMEYFVIERTPQTRVAYQNAQGQTLTCWEDELPPEVAPESVIQRRQAERREVKWYKLTANEILEEGEWDGQYIPIIPVIGKEQNIDGDRKWVGVIRPSKDAQRLFNYSVSTAVEVVALEPKAPFIGAEGQFEGHEAAWQQANWRNFPYLQYKPQTVAGQPAPPPQRNTAGANLGPALALVDQADGYIQATTFVYDPSLGSSAGARSGKAVLALQQQADAGNSNYLDNLAQVSMTYEAKVLMDLIPRVYDRPGRIARILKSDDSQAQVMLNAPFAMNPSTNRPTRVAGAPGQTVPMGQMSVPVKQYNLTEGRYLCTVSVGRAYRNRAEQASDEIGQILANAPNLLPMIGDLYFKYRDFPGHDEISARLKRLLPPEARDQDAPADPQQLMAVIEQIKAETGQMIDSLTAQLNEASEVIKGKQMELQAELQKTQMELQSKEAIAQLQAQTQLLLAQQRTEATREATVTQAEVKMATTISTFAHEQNLQRQKSAEKLNEYLVDAAVQDEAARATDAGDD